MLLRPVTAADKPLLLAVEAQSTPNLRYLPAVYEQFLADAPQGEFMLTEEAGQVLGCAKYTRLPDGSAWLETLRVVPEAQGRGLGKRMYRRFFELAREQGVRTMRMYTGAGNVVSRGLAEHFGFRLEETFMGFTRPVTADYTGTGDASTPFRAVTDAAGAAALLLPLRASWGEFLVMNRTFLPFSEAVCADLARREMVYASGDDVVVLGARFSPEEAQHVLLFSGDASRCLAFADALARQQGAAQLVCLCCAANVDAQLALGQAGFTPDGAPYIVMRVEVT
ncbi:GNAT family N-acetyltransferase [Deinococcus fonticola]|uniref:GNAT family N-acetyltransferase n=1 Tax=Deinococcus fonticola TaxID=2528713 RepID=UPI0010756DC9|nr:GNAT family N-acetyltransferase [Deinococcus fonticola]